MAGEPTKKISALPVVSASSSADSIPIVRAGVTSRIHPASGGGLDSDTLDGQHAAALCPVGIMAPYAGSSAPSGWLLCDGQAVSRTTYSALFSAIGTTWGVGNGSSTFNVPDMRESAPVGAGTFSAVTGSTHGSITAHDARALGAFADDQMQGHRHNFRSNSAGGSPAASYPPYSTNQADSIDTTWVKDPTTDGTNGTPRTGAVTRGKTIGVNFIIKY